MQYLRDNRLPTGIQRVQMNIISSLMQSQQLDGSARAVFYDLDKAQWRELSKLNFLQLINAAQRVDTVPEQAWQEIRDRICQVSAPVFSFKRRDVIVNLGTSWWIKDYFLTIRNLKMAYDIRYVPLIHDCIPLITPEYCAEGLTREFRDWIGSVFRHSDAYLANSNSTARDLRRIAQEFGFEISEPTVIRLDGDPRGGAHPSEAIANGRQVFDILVRERVPPAAPFVLMVSTLEARKNHILALQVWDRLIGELGEDRTPYLICAGKPGWRFEATKEFLGARKRVKERVRFISNLSDPVLAELYSRALFTVYPSHYEGWGLPVTKFSRLAKSPPLRETRRCRKLAEISPNISS